MHLSRTLDDRWALDATSDRSGQDCRGIKGLSGRELEVARLVVDRGANPEIGADLFLGLRTVETRMPNIFRKLGVPSRVEVAGVVEHAGSA